MRFYYFWPVLKATSSNKSIRIHVTKEYNNQNTTNKWKAVNYKTSSVTNQLTTT
jgi:hypothetical protein